MSLLRRKSFSAVAVVAGLTLATGCAAESDAPDSTEEAVVHGSAVAHAADAYFAAWMGGVKPDALRAVLAPDVRVELLGAPLMTSADAYIALLTGPGGGAIRCAPDRFIQKVYGESEGSFLYECDSPAGPLVFSETLTVRGGRVVAIRGVSDLSVFGLAAPHAALLESIRGRVFVPKDVAGYDDVLDAAYVFHTGGHDLDRAAFKSLTADALRAMPDLDEHLHVIEANGDGAVAMTLLTGTHTGAPFLGVPATGRRVSFTGTHIFRMSGGKVVEDWAEASLADALTQLTQPAPAPTMNEMEAAFAAAEASARADCPAKVVDPLSPTLWTTWTASIQSGHESEVLALHAPHFRRSFGLALDGDIQDLLGGLAFNRTIGTVKSLAGLAIHYQGSRVVAAAGPVDFEYLNAAGAFGLPARQTPKRINVGEVHVLRSCGGRVTRQYSNVDVLGLIAAAREP